MKAGYFTIQGKDCYPEIIGLLEREIKVSFKSNIIDGILFFAEDFSLMNSSDLMIVIRIQKANKKDDSCEIEIVAGGGGEGIFFMTYGNEKRRLNKIVNMVHEFCAEMNYQLSEVAITK